MNVEREIQAIKQRNARVEADKKWETSWTRRVVIGVLTFAVVLIYNWLIFRRANFILAFIVPVIGFLLSTLSLKYVRKVWENRKKEL